MRAGTGAVPVGKALVRAKQIYLATTPQMRGLHQKAFLEATLFGLPMLSVNMPGARLGLNADQSIVNATRAFDANPGSTLGLTFAGISVTPSLNSHQLVLTDPDGGPSVTATSRETGAASCQGAVVAVTAAGGAGAAVVGGVVVGEVEVEAV